MVGWVIVRDKTASIQSKSKENISANCSRDSRKQTRMDGNQYFKITTIENQREALQGYERPIMFSKRKLKAIRANILES